MAWEEYLQAEDEVPKPRTSRLPKRRVVVGLLVGLLVAAVLLTAGAMVFASSSPESSNPGDEQSADAVQANGATSPWLWERTGVMLPVSSADGPTTLGDAASGFARTSLGAALAAAHLSVRIDPAAGPGVYRPTIENQMAGGTGRVLAAVDAQYLSEAAASSVADGAPLPVQAATIDAYRVDEYNSSSATVHLLVTPPAGGSTDFAVAVVWDEARGDWILQAPAADAGAIFPTTGPGQGYTAFLPEEAP